MRSTRLPKISSVTAASSATGRSEVPAQITPIEPSFFGSGSRSTVMQRARSCQRAVGKLRRERAELLLVRAAHEQHAVVREDRPPDGEHLRRRLARAENDLGKSAAPRAIGVHAREAEIDEAVRHQRPSDSPPASSSVSRIGIIFDSHEAVLLEEVLAFAHSSRSVSSVMRRKSFFFA